MPYRNKFCHVLFMYDSFFINTDCDVIQIETFEFDFIKQIGVIIEYLFFYLLFFFTFEVTVLKMSLVLLDN